jgi:hypothetical protein
LPSENSISSARDFWCSVIALGAGVVELEPDIAVHPALYRGEARMIVVPRPRYKPPCPERGCHPEVTIAS